MNLKMHVSCNMRPLLFFLSLITEVLEHPFLQPRQQALDPQRPRNRWVDCKQYTEGQKPINYKVFKGIFTGSGRGGQSFTFNRNLGRPRKFHAPKARGGICVKRCVDAGSKPRICSKICRCKSQCRRQRKSIERCSKRCPKKRNKRG